jgi:hypothetical protein
MSTRPPTLLALAALTALAACHDVRPDAITAAVPPTASGPHTVRPAHPLSPFQYIVFVPWGEFRHAIDPGAYVCSTSTPVRDWFGAQHAGLLAAEPATYSLLHAGLPASVVVEADAVLFRTTDTPQYFGYRGEYTRVLQQTERDVKRFWDIASGEIQLIGMHGSMLLDTVRVATSFGAFMNGVIGVPTTAEEARGYARSIRNTVLESRLLNAGDHPILSFNAFAVPMVPQLISADKIIMGDGVLDGFGRLGFGDVAPQALYAHEFAHHIQYQRGWYQAGADPEGTRYTELMADAMAAYYLTHKRGGTMNKHRVAEFLEAFFQIGDCAFSNPNHHGTPNQRLAAARFGFDVADQAQKQGHILTSDQFHALFVATYPQLVGPDAR